MLQPMIKKGAQSSSVIAYSAQQSNYWALNNAQAVQVIPAQPNGAIVTSLTCVNGNNQGSVQINVVVDGVVIMSFGEGLSISIQKPILLEPGQGLSIVSRKSGNAQATWQPFA